MHRQIGLAFTCLAVGQSVLSKLSVDRTNDAPAVDHLLENHHSLGVVSSCGRDRLRLAPKEQPPRKLSGNKDRKTTDTLESGRAQARSTEEERRCDSAPNLSGFVTEGASCRRMASTMRDPMEP